MIQKKQVPTYQVVELSSLKKRTRYCVGIPLLNEGNRIRSQLQMMHKLKIHTLADIILFDGGSDDGSTDRAFLESVGVRTLLIKNGPGKQGAQFRMGFHYVLEKGYQGVVTIDGNNKDSVKNIPDFIAQLETGTQFIQGSRFVRGGYHENTPLMRWFAVRFIHAPWISVLSGFWYTDTTSAYRGINRAILEDHRLNLFRDIFNAYELLFFMSARIPRLGYKTQEIAVCRCYPPKGRVPTKIKFKTNFRIIWELVKLTCNVYDAKP
jgi:dolichol-phosphate mannosyltransferase